VTPSVTGQATTGTGDVPAVGADGTGDGAGTPAVGRNVFAPLVDPDAAPTAGPAGTAPAEPTTAPPADPVALPSVRTVTVPGAVVTSTQIIAGPTATTTRTVTSTADAGYEVEVVSVADTASATSAVTFAVDGSPVSVAANGSFGPAGAFTYTGYDTVDDLVAFTNGSVSVTLPVGASIVFP
jgi:cell wall-associated NlpC family hydrolase